MNLRVLGEAIDAGVAAGTRIDLPGLGHVTLRHIDRFGNGTNRRGLTVTMLVIRLTHANTLGLPVGSDIRVAQARSLYDRDPVSIDLHGAAWAASGGTTTPALDNRIGRVAVVYLGCEGSNGAVKQNEVNLLRVGDVVRSGVGVSTVQGDVVGPVGTSRSTSTIKDLSLLDGLVTADLVKGVARASFDRSSGEGSVSSEGSRFVNLRIAGVPVTLPITAGAELPLAGFGTITFFERDAEVTATGADLRVYMIHIRVSTANELGIPVGSDLLIGVAKAGANR